MQRGGQVEQCNSVGNNRGVENSRETGTRRGMGSVVDQRSAGEWKSV